jgi:hypothetical protein
MPADPLADPRSHTHTLCACAGPQLTVGAACPLTCSSYCPAVPAGVCQDDSSRQISMQQTSCQELIPQQWTCTEDAAPKGFAIGTRIYAVCPETCGCNASPVPPTCPNSTCSGSAAAYRCTDDPQQCVLARPRLAACRPSLTLTVRRCGFVCRLLASLGTTCQRILGTAHAGGTVATWNSNWTCNVPRADNSNCDFLVPSPSNPTLQAPDSLNQHLWVDQYHCDMDPVAAARNECGCTDAHAGFAPAGDNKTQHTLLSYSDTYVYDDGSCNYQALCGKVYCAPLIAASDFE